LPHILLTGSLGHVVLALAIIVAIWSLLRSPVVLGVIELQMADAADVLRQIGFLSPDDLSSALLKIDLLRIVLAVLVFGRFWPEFLAARHGAPLAMYYATVTGLLLSAALAIGIATPLVALLLALTLNLVIEVAGQTYSLGSMVVANALIPILIGPAGYRLSIDAWLIRRRIRPVQALYDVWGVPDLDRVQVGRILALFAYACLTLYSGVQHFASPTWRNGTMTAVLLLSPVASPTWEPLAQRMYATAPRAFLAFSQFSTYGMLVWQLGLLPLALLSRWSRRWVIVWGLTYFWLSTYVLHIKRLGVYEVVLWALVFWGWRLPWRVRSPQIASGQGRLSVALALSVLVLAGIFAVDWAIFDDPKLAFVARRHAPLVFGIGFVNVFNEPDFVVYRHRTSVQQLDVTGHWHFVTYTPSEAFNQVLTGYVYMDVQRPVYCDPDYARLWFAGYALTLHSDDPQRHRPIAMTFSRWTRPTSDEFAAFRPEPIRWETVCVVHGDLDRPEAVTVTR
jgi:hypothetical protein